MSKQLLLTGATGFIGGTVLSQLLNSSYPELNDLSVTALLRKQEQADLLKQKGIDTILFKDLDDSIQLRKVASEFDYVIHTTHGHHTSSAIALIEGLADRKKRTGREVYFIHTSGTSNLAQPTISRKAVKSHEWSDKENVFEFEEAEEAKEPYAQRTTDISVIRIAEREGVKVYIMMPPTIYGRGTGFFNRGSMQIPSIIRGAIELGFPPYIGDGTSSLGHVHVTDLALLYELIFSKILAGEEIPSGRKGIYFCNTGKHNWLELATEVGVAGAKLNGLKSSKPRSVSLDEARSTFLNAPSQVVEMNYASDSATRPVLATELGWKPRKTEEDWIKSFIEAFQMVLDERNQ